MRCVRVSGLRHWGGRDVVSSLLAITIALFAVLHFWAVPAACRRVIGPGRALANADGRAKLDRDCQTMGSSPNRRVGSTASSFGVAQRVGAPP